MNISYRSILRGLKRHAGANLLVMAVLSAGIASVLIIFSFVKALVLDPPPFAHATQILELKYASKSSDNLQNPLGGDLLAWQRELSDVGTVVGIGGATINLSDGVRPERFEGALVTGDIFGLLGIAPSMGRSFVAADFQTNAPEVLMLSHTLWQNRFHSDPATIGQVTRVNGKPTQIIGVMPEGFTFPGF
jgi:putative ABC transport system permease protein